MYFSIHARGRMGTVVVKLGGSVITRKREVSTLRGKVLTRLGVELSEGWVRAGKPPLIVIHGAGSYGHPWAEKWDLAKAPPGKRGERGRGAAVTSLQVRFLDNEVLRALTLAGLPAISVPPAITALNNEGTLQKIELEPLFDMSSKGMVPVTFGDVVRDSSWGFSILSGDRIALEIAKATKVDRVIFVTDVPGIMDKGTPPSVIRSLTPQVLSDLKPVSSGPDVTGGILGKATRMIEISKLGVRTGLISGLVPGRLREAVSGSEGYGSWT